MLKNLATLTVRFIIVRESTAGAGSPQARNAREMEEKRFWQHVGEWNLFQVH